MKCTLHLVSTRALLAALPRRRTCSALLGELLWDNRGRIVPWEDILDCLYGFDRDGGPLGARRSVNVFICHMRARGWPIVGYFGRGYMLRLC